VGAALEQSQQELTEARLKAKLMRDKIKMEAIREYQNSQEFK
jgi:F0F1-type ATP synthase membrane subunit b/b'